MSEERRKKQQEQTDAASEPSKLWRDLAVALVVAAILIVAYRAVKGRRAGNHDAFAKCLAAKQVKMYGLYWCTHCAEQKEIFGPSFQYVPYIECGVKGSRSEEPACAQAGVKNFPTWQFPDGSRVEGAQQLQFLSEKTGCALP
jgi:large repetitive protein